MMAMLTRLAAAAALFLASFPLIPAEAQRTRATPYWASISAGRAMMRTGPGRQFPATWLYVRRDLPVQVVEVYQNWRKVQDPDGTTGWMLVNLLSDTRTAIVRGNAPQPLHEAPDPDSRIRFRAEPGVVGRISDCDNGWCRIAIGEKRGFIRVDHIWGIARSERL